MMSNNATFLSFTVIFTCNFVQKCCMRIGILYNKNPFSLRHWDTSYLFSSKIFGLAYVVIKKENFLVSAIFHTSRDTMKCISGPSLTFPFCFQQFQCSSSGDLILHQGLKWKKIVNFLMTSWSLLKESGNFINIFTILVVIQCGRICLPGDASQNSKKNPNFHCMSSTQTARLKTREAAEKKQNCDYMYVLLRLQTRLNKRRRSFSSGESWLSRLFRICTTTFICLLWSSTQRANIAYSYMERNMNADKGRILSVGKFVKDRTHSEIKTIIAI